jgi:hypothetical protein
LETAKFDESSQFEFQLMNKVVKKHTDRLLSKIEIEQKDLDDFANQIKHYKELLLSSS